MFNESLSAEFKTLREENARLRTTLQAIRVMAMTRRQKIRMPGERDGRSGEGLLLENYIALGLKEEPDD